MATIRGYLTQAELAEYADMVILDATEADDQISQAEEIIDQYVGAQNKSVMGRYRGFVTATTDTVITDTSGYSQLQMNNDYLANCVIEMVSGVNKGLKRKIISSSFLNKSITIETAFPVQCGINDVYFIYQLAKFPRAQETEALNNTFYKFIPEYVKRAVAAQVQYMAEKGSEFFMGATDKKGENIEGYSYQVKPGMVRMIAPKAREYLRGIMNIKGQIIYDGYDPF